MTTHVASVDWSFADRPQATSPNVARPRAQRPRRHRPGRRPHRAGRHGVPARRLAPAPLPLVRGGALRPRRRAAPRAGRACAPPGEGRLRPLPVGTWHALGNAGSQAGPPAVGEHAASPARRTRDAGTPSSPSEPFDLAALDGIAARPPFGDPRLRWIGHYDGTPPAGGGAGAHRSGARPATRWPRQRADGLQRDQREDARRPGLRRRAPDDVHRRLRAGRIGAGPRPPVRGDVLLPRRRDRGRPGRQSRARSARATSSSPASARPTGSSTTATGRVRWIETQAPQPPERHSYRWVDHWKRFEEGVD